MARRGLTLVELLAALALLLLLLALSLPAVQGRMAGARFDSARTQVEAAIVVCRAEAQRQGRVLALTVGPTGRGELGLFMEPIDAAAAAGAIDRAGGEERLAGERGASDTSKPPPLWGALPEGVVVSDQPPQHKGDASLATVEEQFTPPGAPGRMTIAVFFPDGSAASRGPVYISLGEAAAVATINRWTGSAAVAPYVIADRSPEEQEPREEPPPQRRERPAAEEEPR